jgi:hypothetical protein
VATSTVVTGAAAGSGGNPAVGSSTPTSTATCPTGTKLLGGGATLTQGSGARGALSVSAPNATGTAWTATGVVTLAGNGSIAVTAYAICGS